MPDAALFTAAAAEQAADLGDIMAQAQSAC